jgi:hypothetical protein
VRQDNTEVWRLTRGDVDVIKAYIVKHRPENGSQELRAVAWSLETKAHNLERSLKDLTSQFQIHLTMYNLDKQPLKHKFEGIDAKILNMEALVARVGNVEALVARVENVEALVARVGNVEALVARVEKLEQMKSTPASKKPWRFGLGADATAGAETEKKIGALLGDLERLGGERERECF